MSDFKNESFVRISPGMVWEDYESDGSFGASFALNYDNYGASQMFLREHSGGSEYGLVNTIRNLTGNESPFVTVEEANEQGKEYGLKFDRPVRKNALDIRLNSRRKELERQSLVNRGEKSFSKGASNLSAGLLGAIADPLNIASAFVPVVREARAAQMTARLGVGGARIATGAIEGAVGAAIMEAPTLLLAEQAQADYTFYDSLTNVAFGGILGGGLHYAGGKLTDRLQGKDMPPVADQIENTNVATKESAMKTAISDHVEGRIVDVEPILRTDPSYVRNVDDPFDPNNFMPAPAKEAPTVKTFEPGIELKPETLRLIDSIVEELKTTSGGARIFREVDGQGGTPDIIGYKGDTPKWFQDYNKDVKAHNAARKKIVNKNKRLSNENQITVPKSRATITRAKVTAVAEKLKRGETKLGSNEREIAEVIYETALDMRRRNAEEFGQARDIRAEERQKSIDAQAVRQFQEFVEEKKQLSDIARNAADSPRASDIKDLDIDAELARVEEALEGSEDFLNSLDPEIAQAVNVDGLRAELKAADDNLKEAEEMYDSILSIGNCMARG